MLLVPLHEKSEMLFLSDNSFSTKCSSAPSIRKACLNLHFYGMCGLALYEVNKSNIPEICSAETNRGPMLPLIPYAGILRPALILLAILLMILIQNLTRTAQWHRKLLISTFLVYLILLIYATFLSRSVSESFSYRLSLLGAARDSFSLEGGLSQVLPRLIQGDFSGISLTSPRSLEGILINILIFIPLGYLLPALFPKLRCWQVICICFATTVSIEVVQLFTKLGMFDLNDILNNVIGTAAGVVLWKMGKETPKQ